jgi:hypothetical protein
LPSLKLLLRPQESPLLAITRPNSLFSEAPAEATYTDLTPFHDLVPKPSKKRYLADVLEPMSMYGATSGIIDMWNRLLQDHAKEPGDRLSATDYTIVEAVSPYYILRPTSISAWFITKPGLAGRNNPSRESRLTTGICKGNPVRLRKSLRLAGGNPKNDISGYNTQK